MATLQITPKAVELNDVLPGVPRTVVVTIKNTDSRTRTIRVRPPKTKYFSIHGHPQSLKLSPGLETQFEVIFQGDKLDDVKEFVQDKVIIQSESGDYDLVLKATLPKPDVKVIGDLSFGVVPVESKATKKFKIVNDGTAPAKFKVEWDRSYSIVCTPASGEVPARVIGAPEGANEVEVTATITVMDLGASAGDLTVTIGNADAVQPDVRRVTFSTTAVKQGFEVMEPAGALLSEVDFGPHFFGEVIERRIQVFNNGPVESKFMVTYGSSGEMKRKVEDDGSTAEDPDDPYSDLILATRQRVRARATNDNPFTISPLSGSIAPYSKTTITVRFEPKDIPNNKGFTAQMPSSDATARIFDYIALLEFAGSAQKVKLPVKGKGLASGVRMSPSALDFGDITTNTWADLLVDLVNTNTSLGVKFNVAKRAPYFEVQPATGMVLAGQSRQLLVRYWPKAMGKHSGTMPIQMLSEQGAVVQELSLACSGSSLKNGDKTKPVGGIDKLPKDFTKPAKYVDAEQVFASKQAAGAKPTKASQKLWERPDVDDAFKDIGPNGTLYAMSKNEFVTMKQHQDKYISFMREKRTAKRNEHLNKPVDDHDVNLGLDTRSGLVPFEPHLPRGIDPLWTVGGLEEGKPKQQRNVSEAELEGIPIHSSRPETDTDMLACSRELTREQINKLIVGPKVVDFGRVSVGSTATQHLLVVNTLDTPVHVVLDLKSQQELRNSKHASQVVPPGARAKFPLTLIANEIRSFADKVEYCVNGNHILSFTVSANVVPVTVGLSTEELHFEFSLDNWESFIEKLLVLDNPHKFPVEFSITCTNPTFSVTPSSGRVRPQSGADVMVRWAPPLDGSMQGLQEGHLVVTLVGGDAPRRVFVQGQLPEGALRARDKALDAGAVALGVPQTITAQLKNHGTRAAAFKVVPNPRLKVTPDKAKVAPDETADLEVSFVATEAGPLTTVLEIQVQGSKPIRIPFKAEGVVPNVEVAQDEFNFGAVYIGAFSKLPVTLVNTTPVPAMLMVDLLKHPEFQLTIAKDAWSPQEYEECPLQKINGYGDKVAAGPRVSSSLGGSRRGSRRESSASGFGGMAGDGSRFHITINPNKELHLQLAFKPRAVKQEAIELAFATMASGSTPVEPVRRVVTAEGSKPRLVVSKSSIDFGTRVVIRSNQIKAPYSTDIYLTNNEEAPVAVTLGAPTGPDSTVFTIEPSNVTVQPGEMVGVSLHFCPRDGKSYECLVPVYLDHDMSQHYMMLEVAGTGQYPRLTFDVRECLLPAVPLGVTSRATFHIINNGYDNLELKFRLPADESHVPMSIEFPEGNLIGVAKEKLPVVVSFTATKPISFTAHVHFMDEDGKRYSVPVTSTADNCLLTHQAFMQAAADQLAIEAPNDGPVRLRTNGVEYPLPSSITALGPMGVCRNIVRYLNATTGRGPYDQIHSLLVGSKGKAITELVELLSGKAVPGKAGRLSTNKKDAAEQLLAAYDALLAFLKAHGALVNAVKPEMLLDFDDFCRVLNSRGNSLERAEDLESLDLWAEVENNFDTVSVQAWNTLLLQIFKVFVLGRITLKAFKTLPGLPPPNTLPGDAAIVGSNLYSVPESVLLAWATGHYVREFGTSAHRLTNFDTDFKDGLALYSLLSGYWPSAAVKRSALHVNCVTAADCHDNADLIVRILHNDLGLPYNLMASDIAEPDAREMVVLLLYLYQTLPQFVPRTTIEFNCKLGETQMKDLELSNPSKKAIAYIARLEGHKDFSMDASLVRIEAKGSARLPIKCAPTTSVAQEARLVLMSKHDGGGANAATLVFLLRANVNTRAPLKRVRTEGPLYELQQFEFTVTNPFPADCDFTISLLHEPAEPLPKKDEGDKKGRRGASNGRSGGSSGSQSPRASGTNAYFQMLLNGGTSAGKDLPPAKQSGPKQYPSAFGLDRNRLRLKQNASDKVKASFLPFTMGTHYCTVVLRDKDQGEFVYELVGDTALPAPIMEQKGVVPLEGPLTYNLFVPYTNSQLEMAKRQFLDKHPLAKDKAEAGLLKADAMKSAGELEYAVSQTNSLVACADKVTLSASAPAPAVKPGEPVPPGLANTLALGLKPIGTGIYPVRLLLTSPLDTRVVDLELTAQTMTQQFQLDFECAARQAITQDIPLVNTSDQYMTVMATINGSKAFTGTKDVSVPPGATVNYQLTFRPTVAGDVTGTLELAIPATGERNVYTLLGKAAEPVAEGHIVVECQARKPVVKNIAVPNIMGAPVEYSVLCDLDVIAGPEMVKVNTNQATTYKFTACPTRSGLYLGSLTFKANGPDAGGQYVWYSLEVRASEPPEVGVIEVEAQVRTAVSISIPIMNPLSQPVELSVKYSDPALLGPQRVTLPVTAGTGLPVQLEFYYAPLVAGDKSGSILLYNDDLGEFWYQLHMHASPAAPQPLPPLTAELGGAPAVVPLRVENPLDRSVVMSASSSNPAAFSVSPAAITLAPYAVSEVLLEYTPTRLGQGEEAYVTINSEEAGTWEYLVSGRGEAPAHLEPTTVTATLNGTSQALITWRNPFLEPVRASVRLEGPDAGPGREFELLMTGRADAERAVAPGASLQVPLCFNPRTLRVSSAELVITAQIPESAARSSSSGEEPAQASARGHLPTLSWRYPVQGVAEAEAALGSKFRFKCKARSKLEETMEVILAGLAAVSPDELFTHELVVPPQHATALSAPGVLQVVPLGPLSISSPGQPLKFAVRFAPQHMMSAEVELIVHKASGGRWRFEVQLVASEPDTDGILTIESAMGQTTALTIPLYSSTDEPQPYTAYFSSDTPLSFDVRPAKGVLPPQSVQGEPSSASLASSSPTLGGRSAAALSTSGSLRRTSPSRAMSTVSRASPTKQHQQPQLEVTYTCREFGKVVKGRLFVQTPDMHYSFELRGRMPSYVPPSSDQFKPSIDNKLAPELARRLDTASSPSKGRPNFVAQNARSTRTR